MQGHNNMIEVERVRSLIDGVESVIDEYRSLSNPTADEHYDMLGRVLGTLDFYRERFKV